MSLGLRGPHATVLLGLTLAACGDSGGDPTVREAEATDVWFREEAVARGLRFEHASGATGDYHMPEIMGGGAALFDLEQDGDLDAYLVQSGRLDGSGAGNRLFENTGAGHFRDVSGASGADDRGYGMGVATGDVNEDGREDLFVTNVGPDRLFVNTGQATFEDRTKAATLGHPGWGTSASFFDADRDGDLDLFVTQYLDWNPRAEIPCFDRLSRPDYCSPKNYKSPARDLFYRNDGSGHFVDESRASGVDDAPGTGLGVGAADFDGDGWIDVFVANDGMPDRLWSNRAGRTFKDVAMLAGCAVDTNGLHKAGMGVAIDDVDRDGDPDLLVCNLKGETDSFYLNQGGTFLDRTTRTGVAGVSKPYTRFGLGLHDFDNDGLLDLFQANGRVERPTQNLAGDPYAEPNLVFRGLPEGRFEPLAQLDGCDPVLIATSRAAAFGDVNDDGFVDVLVVNRDGPAHLLLGVPRGPRRGLRLDVREAGGRAALGAAVRASVEGRPWLGIVRSDTSYLAASDPRLHLALDPPAAGLEVVVTFVDGVSETFGPLHGPGTHVLRRGQGRRGG